MSEEKETDYSAIADQAHAEYVAEEEAKAAAELAQDPPEVSPDAAPDAGPTEFPGTEAAPTLAVPPEDLAVSPQEASESQARGRRMFHDKDLAICLARQYYALHRERSGLVQSDGQFPAAWDQLPQGAQSALIQQAEAVVYAGILSDSQEVKLMRAILETME